MSNLVKSIQKTERARARRQLDKGLNLIWSKLRLQSAIGNINKAAVRNAITDTFKTMRKGINPKKKREWRGLEWPVKKRSRPLKLRYWPK